MPREKRTLGEKVRGSHLTAKPDEVGIFWRGEGRQGGTGGVGAFDGEGNELPPASQGLSASECLGEGPKAVYRQVYSGGRHFYVDENGKEVKLNL